LYIHSHVVLITSLEYFFVDPLKHWQVSLLNAYVFVTDSEIAEQRVTLSLVVLSVKDS